MELEHFSHIHPLIYDKKHNDSVKEVVCFGCSGIIFGASYNCGKCSFFLHKKCAQLPQEIKHPFHRNHPLTLLMARPYTSDKCWCDLCGKRLGKLVYNCALCKFDLDLECALQRCVVDTPTGNYEHQFIHLMKAINFTCDSCGTEGTESPYMCSSCQIMVHKNCISLPKVMEITEHEHVITHFYFLPQESRSSKLCGICHGKVDINHGSYYCSDCDFISHVNCVKHRKPKYQSQISIELANPFSEETSIDEEQEITGNKQFSHEHEIIIIDEVGDKKRCDGCMLPISAPIHGCLKCNMFLHKKCSELPTKTKHPLHESRPLTLLLKAPSVDGLFKCNACEQYCHGFCYHCNKCDFYIDIRCSSIFTTTLEHSSHDHLLRLVIDPKNHGCYCSACYCNSYAYFNCTVCNFTLDFKCAALPNSARHRLDENHPLTLKYDVENFIEDYCMECEVTINPGSDVYKCVPWFYACKDCDISIHPDCVLGKYPYINFGGAYSFDIHPHPLTLVQKPLILVERMKHYPSSDIQIQRSSLVQESSFLVQKKKYYNSPCDHCAQPFFDDEIFGEPYRELALQCTECNFIIHREGLCFTQHVLGKTNI